MKRLRNILSAALCLFLVLGVASTLWAQLPTGSLRGTATDQTGAVIKGAQITVTDQKTQTSATVTSGDAGDFALGNLNAGLYTVTVTAPGFKQQVFKDVKIDVGLSYTLNAKLQVGAATETVVAIAGAEVLKTDDTSTGATVTGREITELPFTSKSALDLATLAPGAATTGQARQTSFDGLPRGAINITYDGINVQDNLLKGSDGFFTIIQPRTDAVQEFSISTATNSAADASQGAVQIKMETQRGGNAFHGGGWEYFRNDYLNANYYFNNIAGLPVQRQRLNQFGGKIGGPIFKDKLFFFADMDNSTNPNARSTSRAVPTAATAGGLFTYGLDSKQPFPGANPNAYTTCLTSDPRNNGGGTCTTNMALWQAAFVGTNPTLDFNLDPASTALLNDLAAAHGMAGVSTSTINNTYLDNAVFNARAVDNRRYPDIRLDYNLTKNDQISAIYHYSHFFSSPDLLNGLQNVLPSGPLSAIQGSQISNRNEWVGAWRRNIGATMSNEVRFGFQSSLVSFFPDQQPTLYPTASNNLGSTHVRPGFALAGMTQPILAFNQQGRNTPLGSLLDNLTWSHGKHSMAFGFQGTELRFHGFFNAARAVQNVTIGLSGNDPLLVSGTAFSSGNFPGIIPSSGSTANLTNLENLYAALTGRVSAYSGTQSVNPATQQYQPGASQLTAGKQHEFYFYGSDSWRMRPNLTVNYGLGWDLQLAPYDTLNDSFSMVGGFNDVFGVSGLNNIFKPGTLTGTAPAYQLNNGRPWYNTYKGAFSPTLGIAWQPENNIPGLKALFPGGGKTVIRAGYSIAYTREGFNAFDSIAFSNPGIDSAIFANAVTPVNCATAPAVGSLNAGCLRFNDVLNGGLQTLATNPATFPATGTVPVSVGAQDSINALDPNLKTPRVQSWSLGIQREIGRDTVFEIRYVANHSTGLWRQDNINEVNIFENGFLDEFNKAVTNLGICRAAGQNCLNAQAAAGISAANRTVNNFANFGLAGQVALPIMQAGFGSTNTSSFFRNTTLVNSLAAGTAGNFGAIMANPLNGFMCRLAGPNAFSDGFCTGAAPGAFPANLFQVNPDAALGGAFRIYNGAQSTYNSLQMEVRRRMSHGLQVTGNYTFSKSLTNFFADSSLAFSQPTTIRNLNADKGLSPWDLRNTFKLSSIYELPFGPGKRFTTSNSFMNKLIEGWQVNGINRIQSGRNFEITSGNGGTFNGNDPGVTLNGITAKQIQSLLNVRLLPGGKQLNYFPASLLSSTGSANTSIITPCNIPGQLCSHVFLNGPRFFRTDLSVAKKTNITERMNIEMRAEALDAFNNVNFFYPGSETTSVGTVAATSTTFGQITNSFRDPNTTNDNGGRILQLVFRVNF